MSGPETMNVVAGSVPVMIPFVSSEGVMSNLFDDLKALSDHETELVLGAAAPPKQLKRLGHPALASFPPIDGEAYEALRQDIRANGQKWLITMRDGYIWNGRARFLVCQELNIVPKLDLLRRGNPVDYLMNNHRGRYGESYSPEWIEARKKLSYILSDDWKRRERENRAAWTAYARQEFKQKVSAPRRPCAVCGMSAEYSHAHHSLPLNMQYDLGIEDALHDHDWLCPVHHKLIHQQLSVDLLGVRRSRGVDPLSRYPTLAAQDAAKAATAGLVSKARGLFMGVGGWPYTESR